MEGLATVASSLISVSEIDRSIQFYGDVFQCETALRDGEAALLLAPGGFQIYLIEKGGRAEHPLSGLGVQHLMWATDSAEALQQLELALKRLNCHTDSHSSGGIRFVEGRDPDGIKVVIACPSPSQRPRSILDLRLYT
jgi:catechol 2,3-dioxygenase-like lactoylglutathione lyase family enzyme